MNMLNKQHANNALIELDSIELHEVAGGNGVSVLAWARVDGVSPLQSGTGDTDLLRGRDGNDVLIGNRGNDFVFGENGNDLIIHNEGD